MALTFTVTTGKETTGLWCDRCLLPSAMSVPVYAQPITRRRTDPARMLLGNLLVCTDCATFLNPPAPDPEPDDDLDLDDGELDQVVDDGDHDHDNIGW